jgi:organic radical activating enzyme
MSCDANIVEVFSSLQGEGLFVGYPQLFIRLGGCNLRCTYCDTPEGLSLQKTGRIETRPFSGKWLTLKNPVAAPALLAHVFRLIKGFPHYHSVSITGGEPLLHTDFLKAILPPIRKKLPILLETNGTLPARLKAVIKLVDIVSMDIKMPSDLRKSVDVIASDSEAISSLRDCHALWARNDSGHLVKSGGFFSWHLVEQFLRLAATKPASYIKIVITGNTEKADWLKARQVISKVKRNIPVVLQPVSTVKTTCVIASDVPRLSLRGVAEAIPIRLGINSAISSLRDCHALRARNDKARFMKSCGLVKPVTYSKLLKVYEMMQQGGLTDVRVIPQVHRLMKWK